MKARPVYHGFYSPLGEYCQAVSGQLLARLKVKASNLNIQTKLAHIYHFSSPVQ